MKIKGFYILTRRSVMRILAILGIAVGSLYAETTAESKVFSSRVEDVQAELISLKKRLPKDSSRAQLPDVQYLEYKSVYLEAKRYNEEHENPEKTARRDASPHHAAVTQRLRHSRRGSGLKGKRTERMVEQLADFTAWLRGNPINERDPAHTVGARASLFWRLHEKTFKRDAVRVGEKRGFGSEKTLAAAFRNSKA